MLSTAIRSGSHQIISVAFGETLVLTDEVGGQAAQLIPIVAGDHRERFSPANTLMLNKAAFFSTGHILYSYFCQPLMTIVQDSAGKHSILPTPLGSKGGRSWTAGQLGRDLLRETARDLGLRPTQLPFPFQAFVHHDLDGAGQVSAARGSRVGDTVHFRADLDLTVAIINNPYILGGTPNDTVITVKVVSPKGEA
jgi:uncharacterized protein YcgI (DUF1989 family)